MKKPNFLFFCGLGYIFEEVYLHVIKDLAPTTNIDLLMADYYLSDRTFQVVRQLKKDGIIKSYKVVRAYWEQKGGRDK